MSENEEKKESLWKKGLKIFKKIPSFGRKIVIFIVLLLFVYLGLTLSSNFSSHTKATQFGLRDMGELITQTGYVTVLQDSKENREFFKLFKIPFTESRMIFSYDFTVDASVNFEKISYVTNDKKQEITVNLPHAMHYKTTLIIDSQEVYLDEDSLFSRIDLKEVNDAMLKMEKEAKDIAIRNGLLEAADKNAQRIISAMLTSDSSRKNYKVNYKYID